MGLLRLRRSETGSAVTVNALPVAKDSSVKSGPLKVLTSALPEVEVSIGMRVCMDNNLAH